ncbi:thioesterase II family protein [Streptomyces sp. H27-D2]|uniref:thioesterase II family protein n=1 Tax=Streptomyces sp. H27-D2 TaxID=3046304 RepID=UPI002DBF80D1|nr:alpha/beta fold hydrolase [Streptomyces sp. H27-D2]MEC4020202.1 alpha/beta fold hydrolase [Streptomyces sp. H27-D2]
MRLYCFPHAGATSSVYRPWKALETPRLQICGVDQPGRGTRIREPNIDDFRALVESMTEHVVADLLQAREQVPHLGYATFGHSFGSMLSLSVAAAVARAVGQSPLRAILSAALPPRLQPFDETASLTDAELLDKIVADGGTPPELLADKAMARYLVRPLREDYAIRRQFPQESSLRVDFPLTLVAAREDEHVPSERMWKWSEHSSAPCRRVEIPGGHFAPVQEPGEILAIVSEDISRSDRATAVGTSETLAARR